ncbi:MAG TPA: four-carbon acid sugar kinase family protein [Amnibacterium sp.]|nr:four-carbon acid sugar kinase family protein [Amnibacterium sp.]
MTEGDPPAAAALPFREVPVGAVGERLGGARRLVVLDDDPTGTQTVADVPVLTGWSRDDLTWALQQGGAGFFVLTNTRSLSPEHAAARNREVAEAALAAAEEQGLELAFASRSDSTLRGHFPLETDVLASVAAERGRPVDAVLLVPAYVDAGRVTVDGVHWVVDAGRWTPVGESEFAGDATFGFGSSRLADWVEEKSGRPVPVVEVPLATVRAGDERLAAALGEAAVIVPDVVTDDDLRAVAVAELDVERGGRRILLRTGPSYVRARLGQAASPPLDDERLAALVRPGSAGLVVVGSHVGRTTRQLERLREAVPATEVVLDVARVLEDPSAAVADIRERVLAAEDGDLVVLSTSRGRVAGTDEATSLAIARNVSAAMSAVVADVVRRRPPAFVVAKGGITSSDTATVALGIRRAWVRGTLLPGIVSLWEPVDGPAAGLPYVVFAGNVGDDGALASVVERLVTASGRRGEG